MFAYPRALPSFRRPGLAAGLCVATLLLVTAGSRAAGAEGPEEVVRGLAEDAVAIEGGIGWIGVD